MISGKIRNVKKRHANHDGIVEITFPPLSNVGSSDPVIIKVYISGRQVNRVYLDGGTSCEVIYEHCFLKLKSLIRYLRVESNTPLFGFSGEQSWPLGEVPLEVTIGEGPIANRYATNRDRGVHSPWSYKISHAQRTSKAKEEKPSVRMERSDP
ncbi:hypothetical protein Tco_0062533 [Tanacetum coccineum]